MQAIGGEEAIPTRPGERDVIEPENVLPAQFFNRGVSTDLQPEKRLMLAVLEDAVACFQKYALSTKPAERQWFAEAAAWLTANDRQWPYSFVNICDVLDLDAGRLYNGLLQWKQRRQAGLTPAVGLAPFRRMAGTRHKATGYAPGISHREVA